MKKGIVIYALGHENYYRMAENLAASLIANGSADSGIKICLICDDESKLVYPHLFDDIVLLQKEKFYTNGKITFTDAIILVYDLSPYNYTIKLDADIIWIEGRQVKKLFEELENIDITFSNKGSYPIADTSKGHSIWAKETDILKAYNKLKGDEKMFMISAEFMYFRKSKISDTFFNKAKKIYNEKKIVGTAFSNGNFTEELAFQIAFMLTTIYPHKEGFTPIYNMYTTGNSGSDRRYPYELICYYGYSIFGNIVPQFIKDNYNLLAKHYFAKLGLLNPYQVVDKRTFLPERKSL